MQVYLIIRLSLKHHPLHPSNYIQVSENLVMRFITVHPRLTNLKNKVSLFYGYFKSAILMSKIKKEKKSQENISLLIVSFLEFEGLSVRNQ